MHMIALDISDFLDLLFSDWSKKNTDTTTTGTTTRYYSTRVASATLDILVYS